jgi:hypothetical protein
MVVIWRKNISSISRLMRDWIRWSSCRVLRRQRYELDDCRPGQTLASEEWDVPPPRAGVSGEALVSTPASTLETAVGTVETCVYAGAGAPWALCREG